MANSFINPFNMTNEQLLEYAMNPNKNTLSQDVGLDKYSILGVSHKPYDPYKEQQERYEAYMKGAYVPDFNQKLDFKAPAFQEQKPDDVLIDMNVREQQDEFRRQQDMKNTLSGLFTPVRGNTPEERAKSSTINQLLAEIDNFAVQYNLSSLQREQLKTNVLSNHLGEYIQTKNALTKQDRDRYEAGTMDLARGRNRPDGRMPRDPVNGFDENGMAIGRSEKGGGGQEEDSEESELPPAAAGAGDIEEAINPIQQQELIENAKVLIRALNRGYEGDTEKEIADRKLAVDKLFQERDTKTKLKKTIKTFMKPADKRTKNIQSLQIDELIPFFIASLGMGEELSNLEINLLASILWETRTILEQTGYEGFNLA